MPPAVDTTCSKDRLTLGREEFSAPYQKTSTRRSIPPSSIKSFIFDGLELANTAFEPISSSSMILRCFPRSSVSTIFRVLYTQRLVFLVLTVFLMRYLLPQAYERVGGVPTIAVTICGSKLVPLNTRAAYVAGRCLVSDFIVQVPDLFTAHRIDHIAIVVDYRGILGPEIPSLLDLMQSIAAFVSIDP